jgi:hypothetical protein
MSGVGPDTYRVGPGNILQFRSLNQFTALHLNPSSITVFTGSRHWTNIHSQKPLTMHKTPFIFSSVQTPRSGFSSVQQRHAY